MAPAKKDGPRVSNFKSISVEGLPDGRKGKHHQLVLAVIEDLERLEEGRALRIPLAELSDSKANIRAALNRATRKRNMNVATSSDDEYFYVWRPSSHS
jgi:hypothetical protein